MIIKNEQLKIIRNRIEVFKEKYNLEFERPINNRWIVNSGWDNILFSECSDDYQISIGILLHNRFKLPDIMSEIVTELNGKINISNEIYLLIITQSVKEKIILLKSDIEKSLNKLIKEKYHMELKYGQITVQVATAFIPNTQYSASIDITDRIRVANYIQSKESCSEVDGNFINSREGAVYTAKLYDLIKLYEQTGEDIFKANLRIGIDDVLGVNSEIQKTLKNSPEDFWFLNNGITLILPKSSINKGKYKELVLENLYNEKNELKVSIINGAQTITAASSFLLEDNSNAKESENDISNREKAQLCARVILKIVTYDDKSSNESENRKFINKVSVALNRQKPIKGQDIALVSSFVLSINELYQSSNNRSVNEQDKFFIIRRGEMHSIPDRQYDLSKLVKVLKAILGKNPSAIKNIKLDNLLAETKNNDDILGFDVNEEIILKDKSIFKPQILLSTYTKDRNKFLESFNKYYSYVNQVMEIEFIMEEHSSAIFKTEKKKSSVEDLLGEYIKKNESEISTETRRQAIYAMATSGKYHLLSCVFYAECYRQLSEMYPLDINEKWGDFINASDFSQINITEEFKVSFMDINKYLKLIEEFIEFWVKFKKSGIEDVSLFYANAFKVSKDDENLIKEYVQYVKNL